MVTFYLKREFGITHKAPEPGEDGINKLQHGKKGNQIGRNVGHQFNWGRGTSSGSFQDISFFPINYSGHVWKPMYQELLLKRAIPLLNYRIIIYIQKYTVSLLNLWSFTYEFTHKNIDKKHHVACHF